ncbi:pseudouridine synthase [uncultured Arcobacter sp.]|uniref:pseudouridine synthase n=1 Tax=uncultured Arcobacter sp. TaxID=165434 RepID=UPI0026200503|nr:pseudouridine synthase [uncultured Arcobacter sp.]
MNETPETNQVRLNKFISHNSKYSRREADTLIEQGRVKVNKKTITDLSTKVTEMDIVLIDNKVIKFEKNKMYTVLVYNKPKGELVTKNDPQGRRIIFDTLGSKYKHFLPIGRLDYSSEGVLLLTDSVEVANGLMHSDLQRVYKIKLNGALTKQVEDAMNSGLELEDATKGARKDSKIKSMNFAPFLGYKVDSIKDTFSKLKVAITEGKNRELRRFFAHFGLDILDLKRVEYGGISLNNLPTGKSRYLTREEYKNLKDYLATKDND